MTLAVAPPDVARTRLRFTTPDVLHPLSLFCIAMHTPLYFVCSGSWTCSRYPHNHFLLGCIIRGFTCIVVSHFGFI